MADTETGDSESDLGPFTGPIEDMGPFTGPVSAEEANLIGIRNSQFDQLRQDPNLVGDLFSLTKREVGTQGQEAQQAFMETVFNRAAARGQSLVEAIHDANYYPRVSRQPTDLSDNEVLSFGKTLSAVGQGSNLSNGATGNASGTVGFAGGPQTYSAGGERFGIEGPDVGQTPAPSTGGMGPFEGPLPTDTPEPPSNTQANEQRLRDFVQGKSEGVTEGDKLWSALENYAGGMIPQGGEQLAQMAGVPTTVGDVPSQLARLIPPVRIQMDLANQAINRIQQIQAAARTPAYSQERYNAGIGTALDLLGLGSMAKGMMAASVIPAMQVPEFGVRGSGKFRATYQIDKELGDMMEGIGAARESGGYRGETQTRNMLADVNAAMEDEIGRYLVSKRLQSMNATVDYGTPEAPDIQPHPQILPESEMQRIASQPQVAKALDYYRNEIKPEIEGLRMRAGLTQEAAAGKTPEFISLIKSGEPIPKPYGGVQQASRLARKTRFAQKATGRAQQYSTNVRDIIKESYSDVMKKARVNDFYKAAHAKGLAEPVVTQTPAGPRSVINFDSLSPELQQQLRAATEIPLKPTGLYKGIRAIQRGTTGIALTANPAEIVNHMRRQLNIVAAKPPVGLLPRLEALIPYIGPKAGTFVRTVFSDANSPLFQNTLQDIIDAGGGSSRSFSNLYELKSPVAKYTGLKWLQKQTHKLLFGIPKGKGFNGWDLRMRVQLEQIRRAVEGNRDPQRIREFANQIGQYGAHPDWIIGALRELNPYAATSLAMRVTELKHMAGISGLKTSAARRAILNAETMLRGTGGTILALTAANYLLSGKYPWENDPGHEFDLNTGLTGEDGKRIYVKLRVIAPELSRPVSTVGIPNLLRERTADNPDYLASLTTALANQGLAIVGGPMQNAALTATTGWVPYVTRAPGGAPKMMDVAQMQKGEDPETYRRGLRQLERAAAQLNPLAELALPTLDQQTQVPLPLGLIERPLAGSQAVKPFGSVFTQSYEKKPAKWTTPRQAAAVARRKLRKQMSR